MKRALTVALLLTFAASPLAAAGCELVCLWRDLSAELQDCHPAPHATEAGTDASFVEPLYTSCTHATPTPLLAALKRTGEAKRSVTAADVTSDVRVRSLSASLTRPGVEPAPSGVAAALLLPLRI